MSRVDAVARGRIIRPRLLVGKRRGDEPSSKTRGDAKAVNWNYQEAREQLASRRPEKLLLACSFEWTARGAAR